MAEFTKETMKALLVECLYRNKITPELRERLANLLINLPEVQEVLFRGIYADNQPALKKELTTKIASILTTGSLNLFGKPALSTDLAKLVNATQENLVANEEGKDNKMIQAQDPRNNSGGMSPGNRS
jgi:hypothetical protein